MPRISIDLEDGKPPVAFTLSAANSMRFLSFMAKCSAQQDTVGRTLALAARLRAALAGVIGASRRKDLEQLAVGISLTPGPEEDTLAAMTAVRVLIETATE